MASQLKVDTITGVATAGSIAITGEGNSTTTNLQQGLAKAWADFDGGDPTIRDSFNTSSFGDNGTGDHTQNLTNAMGSENYSYQGSGQTTLSNFPAYLTPDRLAAHTSSAMRAILASSNNTATDGIYSASAFFGDLA